MPIRVTCSQCKTAYNLADSMAGKKIRCKKCANVVAVPAAENDKEEASPIAKSEKKPPKTIERPASIEDEDEDERPREKAKPKATQGKKSSAKLFILVGVGAAILLLIVGIAAVGVVITFWPVTPVASNDAGFRTKDAQPIDKDAKPLDKKLIVEEKPVTGPIELSAEQFDKERAANLTSFLAKFSNREITLTGVVFTFPNTDGGKLSENNLILRGNSDKEGFMRGVGCRLQAGAKARLDDLVWGEPTKVRGKLDSKDSHRAQLMDCEVLESGPPPSASASLTTEQLIKEMAADRKGTAMKYKDKVVEISGEARICQYVQDGVVDVSLVWQDPDKKFLDVGHCQVRGKDEKAAFGLAHGQTVKIRGRFADSPWLDQGHIVELGPDPSVEITSVDLTREIAADKTAASKKYNFKPARVEGKIVAITKMQFGWKLELAGAEEKSAKPLRIHTFLGGDNVSTYGKQLASLKIGQTIMVRGQAILTDPPTVSNGGLVAIKKE